MHKILFALLFASTFSLLGIADTVDPTGDDNYKTVILTVKQLDRKVLVGIPAKVTLEFGDKEVAVDTELVTSGVDRKIQITVPKREKGKYVVYFRTSDRPSNVSGQLMERLIEGNLESGVREIELRLKRIDVNDMVVTRPNGTTYTAKGSFDLRANWTSYNSVNANTGIGVDVPVGYKYDVKVSAQTEDGRDYYTATLDFTKL